MKKSQQKLLINLGLLLAVLLLFGGFYLFFVQPETAKKMDWGKVEFFTGVEKSDVMGIDIMFRQLTNIYGVSLAKVTNGWDILVPVHTGAYSAEVEKLIDDLLSVKSESVLTNITPEKLIEFGFDEPIAIIDVMLADGTRFNIINGGFAPVDNYYYTMLNHNSNTIYITYAYKFSTSERYADLYVTRNFFSLKATAVTNLEVKGLSGVTYKMAYSGTNWNLTAPKKMPLDNYAVQRKILEFTAMPFMQFAYYIRTPELVKKYGLDKPMLTVKAVSSYEGDGVKEVYISSQTNGVFHYAYTSSLPGIILIDHADIVSRFKITADSFLTPVFTNTNTAASNLTMPVIVP
ncbi:MAG: hypothetical protein A2Y33_14995 [Spirochaetes bacterium GWF1_51_8]|nr:MAG: hypothetical protein A2Y33_14995 [Spirochaetes bacterium GWF1_51_8]